MVWDRFDFVSIGWQRVHGICNKYKNYYFRCDIFCSHCELEKRSHCEKNVIPGCVEWHSVLKVPFISTRREKKTKRKWKNIPKYKYFSCKPTFAMHWTLYCNCSILSQNYNLAQIFHLSNSSEQLNLKIFVCDAVIYFNLHFVWENVWLFHEPTWVHFIFFGDVFQVPHRSRTR